MCIQKLLDIQGKLKSDHICPEKDTGSEKDPKFTPQSDPWYRDDNSNNSNRQQQTLGWGENLLSKVTTLLDSNVQFSTKNHKVYKKTGKYYPFKRKKKVPLKRT